MRISIIGSGNVATHMGAALRNAGHRIVQVYSRTEQSAAMLAYHLQSEAITDLQQLSSEAELFIISVKDDAITSVAEKVAKLGKLIVHTSGATTLQTLLEYTHRAGVFYPLQTFSKTKELDFSQVPMCVEGSNENITRVLEELAATISRHIYRVNSLQRKTLHLAAVFACNFPNYLFEAARQLLAQQELDFNLIRPLIMETAQKVQQELPVNVQTGPAIRHDVSTMQAHLAMLQNQTELHDIYNLLSQAIIKMGEAKHSIN